MMENEVLRVYLPNGSSRSLPDISTRSIPTPPPRSMMLSHPSKKQPCSTETLAVPAVPSSSPSVGVTVHVHVPTVVLEPKNLSCDDGIWEMNLEWTVLSNPGNPSNLTGILKADMSKWGGLYTCSSEYTFEAVKIQN